MRFICSKFSVLIFTPFCNWTFWYFDALSMKEILKERTNKTVNASQFSFAVYVSVLNDLFMAFLYMNIFEYFQNQLQSFSHIPLFMTTQFIFCFYIFHIRNNVLLVFVFSLLLPCFTYINLLQSCFIFIVLFLLSHVYLCMCL